MTIQRGRNFLLSPGPTNIPERVLAAMQKQAVELGSPAFVDLCRSCLEDLKTVFKTKGDVFIYAANGHGVWEAALANVLAPGDIILVPETGMFSSGWAEMAESMQAQSEHIPGDWRHGIDAAQVEERLRADTQHKIKAILFIHTDTASGITSDIPAVRQAIDAAQHPALLMVDAVASLGASDFRMDEWGVDVAVGASQKALMSPPGIGFNAVSQRARDVASNGGSSRYYWDWGKRDGKQSYMWFCGTAPEHLMFALRESLDMIFEESLEVSFVRHQFLADGVRAAIRCWSEAGALQLNALIPEQQSNSVSTIRVAGDGNAEAVILTCRDRFNVSLGRGLGQLQGQAFRIGHMGDINAPFLLGALASVEATFKICNIPFNSGMNAAIEHLSQELPSA